MLRDVFEALVAGSTEILVADYIRGHSERLIVLPRRVRVLSDRDAGPRMPRILIIEDNEAVLRVMSRMLTGSGYDVQEASNGKAGLALYRQWATDIVITDIVMPDVEGLEVIRELRKTDPTVRIIAMSGGGIGSAEKYLALAQTFGAGSVLNKPFTQEELMTVVADALARPQAGPET
jgi:CheY-like chemotaxis protein